MIDIAKALEQVRRNLAALGRRRLATLGLAFVALIAALAFATFLLNRATREVLYAGLEKPDAGRMGAALKEAGFDFDLSSDGASINVPVGSAAGARMMLAERGLPNASSGYELFDRLGSLGLTSFMQDVTRVRALEGELGHSVLFLRGVKAARVHIVLADEGSFRRVRQKASASVLVRLETSDGAALGPAIRKLVSAAVPGLAAEDVSILGSDGVILAGRNEAEDASGMGFHEMEKAQARDLERNIRNTLTPLLGRGNFESSVAVRLNVDKRQTDETVYNPDSKVERSVRVVRETQATQNSAANPPVTVERNLPQARPASGDGKQSSEENQKREETTNFELSSRKTTTVSGGYAIEFISAAVVINKSKIAAPQSHAEGIAETDWKTEIEGLVSSAAGLRRERGDVLRISIVDFSPEAETPEGAAPGETWQVILARNTGSIVASLGSIGLVAIILMLGVRPALRTLARPGASVTQAPLLPATVALPRAVVETPDEATQKQIAEAAHDGALAAPRSVRKMLESRLELIVESDEELAASILRQWIREPTA